MPTTQKKPAASRSGNTGRASTGKGSRKAEPARRPFRREVGGVCALLLALFATFGYFKIDAIFINFFALLLKGLFGYGFWLAAPALLMTGYILLLHRGRPVVLRTVCALLIPVCVGGFFHGLLIPAVAWEPAMLKQLWQAGQALHGGGVLGGILGQVLVQVFSQLGCTIILGLAMVALALGAFHRTPADLANWIFDRPHYEREPEPERAPPPPRAQKAAPAPKQRVREEIDIPVEDGPLVGVEPEGPFQPRKKSFFSRKSKVPAPDEVLAAAAGGAAPAAEAVTPPAPEPAAQPAPPPVPEPVAPPIPEPLVSEAPAPETAAPPAPEAVATPVSKKEKQAEIARAAQEIESELSAGTQPQPYRYPPISLLSESTGEVGGQALAELNANRQRLDETIRSFGIDASIVSVTRGPSVTRYELELDQGVRLNRLTNLAEDIALALGASGVRIAPIPDQISMVGVEVPNKLVSPVSVRSVLDSPEFTGSGSKVSFAVGKDISGRCIVGDIAKMPHLLIAGTTGSGKSVCTNSLIISLLYKASPEEVRLIMIDPKMVELGIYNGIPHLLIPVVTDPKKAAGALQWAVSEMMKRYRTFADVGVRDLAAYNELADRDEEMQRMPQIVVIIDELADLMLVAAKDVEESICRVAQMGRASGMHLVIATQRPSADVITGLMKANIPSRIAFAVSSAMESRIILDTQGAEKLVGRGDMLFAPLGVGKPTRVQGCLIQDKEVAAVAEFVKQSSAAPVYSEEIMQEIELHAAEKEKNTRGIGGSAPDEVGGDYDELIDAAIEVVLETGQASVSLLQRRLKLGYARAARMVDQMEERGVVGPFEGSKPRQLLITKEKWQEMKMGGTAAVPAQEAPVAPAAPVMEAPQLDEADMPPFEPDEVLVRSEEEVL